MGKSFVKIVETIGTNMTVADAIAGMIIFKRAGIGLESGTQQTSRGGLWIGARIIIRAMISSENISLSILVTKCLNFSQVFPV